MSWPRQQHQWLRMLSMASRSSWDRAESRLIRCHAGSLWLAFSLRAEACCLCLVLLHMEVSWCRVTKLRFRTRSLREKDLRWSSRWAPECQRLPHSWRRLAGSGVVVVVVALTRILLGSQRKEKEKDDESTHMTMPLTACL
ncbi:hypothetical protein EYF80_010642 [Liparis tanakae]|uniref:Uncharacterized protein n=1 Tax=Liparis tanakae TaxID=230148 RepID=A0A4Z2IP10_9TELE|nr:hypothetical protein EYF80_010642 [Liparis tanakae]